MIPIGYQDLPETLTVARVAQTEDDLGGSTEALVPAGTVRAKVSQPAGVEQLEAMRAGAAFTVIVHMRPDADVRRGDFLTRPDGDRLRVKYTTRPSEPVYLRADCEQVQAEGDPS